MKKIRFASREELLDLAKNGKIEAVEWGKTGTVDSPDAPKDKKVLFFFEDNPAYLINYPGAYENGYLLKLLVDVDLVGRGLAQYHYKGEDGYYTENFPEIYSTKYSIDQVGNIDQLDKDVLISELLRDDWIIHLDFLEDFRKGIAEDWMSAISVKDVTIFVQTYL